MVGFQSTLGDLFCGVGGFSEGFRQAGFRTIWAVDNWRPAVESFVHNSPGTKVVEEDILNLDLSTLEPVQVLVGSPPCTNFSFANKGGNGDIDSGLRLVKKFIDAIDVLKPRYYIMENIPRLLRVLQDRMKKRALDNYFPQRVLLNASDFGVAQNRRRLFCGRFPLPNPTTCNSKVPLGKMIFGLPSPVGTGSAPVTVRDPVYGFRMPISKLTDHFMDTTIDKASAGRFIRMRRSHPWCGKMRFPDSLNIPSRTIDTIASSPRQSVVISDPRHGQGTYRTLTLRERACVQGFPITFQFWGCATHKDTLVGNAVPPPLARALALSILEAEKLPTDLVPKFLFPEELPPALSRPARKLLSRFPLRRTYRWFVPGTRPYSRVDFDNLGDHPPRHPAGESAHIVEWRALLCLGYGSDYVGYKLDVSAAIRMATFVALATERQTAIVTRVVSRAARLFARTVPDASTLQASWAGRIRFSANPDWIPMEAARICGEVIGKPNRSMKSEDSPSAGECAHFLTGNRVSSGKDWRHSRWKTRSVNLYTACAAIAVSIAVAFANEGTIWLNSNWGRHYSAPPLVVGNRPPNGSHRITPAVMVELCQQVQRKVEAY